ncbi:MAG: glycosyltransferase family 9 protein [bacterium]
MVKVDCRNFPWSKPCRFHKLSGVTCDSCQHYSGRGTSILIIKFDALGDVLRSTAILPSLRDKYGETYVTWVTSPDAHPIFIGNEMVDEVLTSSEDYLPLILSVEFDVVINPDASHRSCHLASIATACEKFGFVSTPNGTVAPLNDEAAIWLEMGANDKMKRRNRRSYQEIIHRMCGLGPGPGRIVLNLTDDEMIAREEIAKALGLDFSAPVVGINAGAGSRWQLKKWHLRGFIKLIDMIRKQCEAQVLLLGGKNEEQRNLIIQSHFGKDVFYKLPSSLRELFVLIDLCDLIVTGDTLSLHASVGLGKRVVALFGPTSPYEIELYGLGTKIVSPIECVPCYRQSCDLRPNCMDLITPEQVFDAVRKEIEISINRVKLEGSTIVEPIL